MPLRQHLSTWVLGDLLTKATKVSQAPADADLLKTCLTRKIVLQDGSWPFMRWDATAKALTLDKRPAVSMSKMLEHLTELVEDFRVPDLVVRFHAMGTSPPPAPIPWKLQLNLRCDRPYDLLKSLVGSTVWMLIGTSIKVHHAKPSALATRLQNLLPSPVKGKGKGRGKNKAPTDT